MATPSCRAEVGPYQNVRSIGEDIVANELLLFEGHRLRPVDIAACGAAGVTEVLVRRRPVVAVLPTGDEIRPVGSRARTGQFYDTNSIMLAAQARELGCEAIVLPIEPDDPRASRRAVREAVAICDLLIIIAGAERGPGRLHGPGDRATSASSPCRASRSGPGHPVMLGAVDSTPVLGAPGYPVSAALSFEVFAAPLIARLEGTGTSDVPASGHSSPTRSPLLSTRTNGCECASAASSGRLIAAALPRGAGVLTSLVRADGLLWYRRGRRATTPGPRSRSASCETRLRSRARSSPMGSNDLALDLAASALRGADVGRSLATWSPGFRAGLSGSARGCVISQEWPTSGR